jgi:phenylacetate-CoA ligase
VDQVIKVRGLFVHPGQLAEIMSGLTEVDRFRAVITRERAMDDLTVEVESSLSLSANTLKDFGKRLKDILKLSLEVVQVEKGTIPEDAEPLDDRRKWD